MKLNTLLKTLGFLALAATPVVAGTAPAPKQPAAVQPANDDLGVNVGLGYHTNYIWRGVNYGQSWIDSSVSGALTVAEGTRLAWDMNVGSMFGDDHFNAGGAGAGKLDYQRLQLGAALQKDVGPATLSLGYRYFKNMGDLANNANFGVPAGVLSDMNDGQEISLGLATALGPINAATSANYDWVNDSWYFDLDLNTNIAVTDSISVVPFFNVGYGKNINWQFTPAAFAGLTGDRDDLTGWTAINTGLRFPIKLNSRATLTPYIAGNLPMGTTSNQSVGGTLDTAFKSVLVGGVSLNVRF
jgi:hypothetical protein